MKEHKESRLTTFLRAPIRHLKCRADGDTLNKAIPAILVKGGFLSLLVFAGVTRVDAGWTPPESSVTPPAVVTLDAFAPPGSDGANPYAALVAGPDGALYGSTSGGGHRGSGTLFRLETSGTFTKLHDFNGTDGVALSAALVTGPDGALYGSTQYGGISNLGTLFRLETNGTFTKLHDFNGTNGANPSVPLVAGPDGALYGSTQSGGASGAGTLFRLETNGIFTKLHDFNYSDGYYPSAALVAGPDGALYGSTAIGGASDAGTLFRLDTNGTFTTLHEFNGTDGWSPYAALVMGPDGALYGSTYSGGINGGYGTLFRLEANGIFAKLHDFNYSDGAYPFAALVVGPDGALYGSTSDYYSGTLFRLETNGTFTKLHDFDSFDSANPQAALVAGPDGALYGSTPVNNSGYGFDVGTLFRVGTNGTFTRLHDFNGTDGYDPEAALVVGPDGALYGSTQSGGVNGNGTLFRLETNGNFTMLHDFNVTEAYNPSAALVAGPDGALYGTSGGGAYGYGTLFRLETDGAFTKLHDFNYSDGSYQYGALALVVGPDGALYGSTPSGGTNVNNYGSLGNGTLFRLETNGTFTKLHDFNGIDGSSPSVPLVVGPDGALYGSTPYGGASYYGTLFRLQTNGTFTTLQNFYSPGGGYPSAALVVGPDGALYGSCHGGFSGSAGVGTLFRLKTNGDFAVLHVFNDNGSHPTVPLVVGPDGALYGTTHADVWGGADTVFRLGTDGAFDTLHQFECYRDGCIPLATVVVGPDGALYGSTASGGVNGSGGLFRLETNGSFTKLHDFNRTNDGYYLSAPLVMGSDGALYGSTTLGGTNGDYGTLFRLETNGTFTKLHDFNGTDGANPSVPLVAGTDGALYGSTPNGGPRGGGILFKLVLNRAPVAQCHDVTVSAGTDCIADASIDNGSFDPDSDPFVLSLNPPGPYPLGTNVVTLTATDNHGASNSCSAIVTVNDTTSPSITCPANISTNIPSGQTSVVVNYPQPTASDNCGGVTVNCAPLSGASFPPGVTTVTCTATDTSGNTNTCSFTVTVLVSRLDTDGDGVPDGFDLCPDSAPGAVVDKHGCSIAQLVPCDGPRSGGKWKNHGQYVSAVTHEANKFLAAGLITGAQKGAIVAKAAQSNCGK